MALTKHAPLPLHPPRPQNYIVLPLYYTTSNPTTRRRPTICTISLVLLAAASAFTFWPSNPDLKIARLRLDRLQFHTSPSLAFDISLFLTVKVWNADVYSIDYDELDVAIAYRGKRLGHVRSSRGHVKARGLSYVDAELEFDGVEVLSDVVYLLEDLARGTVPFDTVTEVRGQLGFFFFQIPLKAKVSCEVLVNTNNQTTVRRNCYPE